MVPDSFGGGERLQKPKKKKTTKKYFEVMEEAGKKHGVKVTDMSKREIRAIGFVSGVGRQDQRLDKPNSPVDPSGERPFGQSDKGSLSTAAGAFAKPSVTVVTRVKAAQKPSQSALWRFINNHADV